MKDKLVTLIGGGGFIGRYVAQSLLQAGARVRVAQRDPRQAWFLKTQGGLGQTQFVAADVTRPETIANAVAGADGVVNLVGAFDGDLTQVHVAGARTIGEAATKAGVGTVVHISAIGADAGSSSRYGQTKGEGEDEIRATFPRATILRPSTVFGREDQFINRFAGLIAKLPVVPVLRSNTKFQPVFVGDVADATVVALRSPDAFGGRIFELGGPEVLTMIGLHRWIAQAIGRNPALIELPDVAGSALASLGFLPGAPLSADQWKMLQHDTVVGDGADGLAALDVTPTPLGAVAPGWLVRYRKNGRFADARA